MRFRTSLVPLLVAAAPLSLLASNANIGIDRDPPTATPVTSLTFGFGANNGGGGDFSFQNETGVGWQNLDVFTTLPLSGPTPVCFPGPFAVCNVAAAVGTTTISYTISFGPSGDIAVPERAIFTIDLNNQGTDPNGTGNWPAGQDFTARANDFTPEPSAGMLTLAGGLLAGAICLYRRRSLA